MSLHHWILPAAALLPTTALAQTAEVLPCSTPVDAGTYVMATGEIIPPSAAGAPKATPGVIYDNTCPVGFFFATQNGTVIIDEGRLPSVSSPAPNKGVLNSYFVTSFDISYCTNEVGTCDLNVFFWEDYDDCDDVPTAGAPTAAFAITGLPASPTGAFACFTLTIDLTGGFEFCMQADGDGVHNGTATGDGFGYGFQFVNQLAAPGGIVLAGEPTACGVGEGTYFNTPGAAEGSGLDNDDLFWREGAGTDTSGCFFLGGSPYASFYMEITADLDDVTCQDDCNANGVGDILDVNSGTSLDLNGNGIPDECMPGDGTPYCFGDGTGNACPCANDGEAGEGCANSTGRGGLLYNFGGSSIGAQDTSMYCIGLPKNSVALYFMGSAQAGGGSGIPVFDGLVCVGGLTRRFPLQSTGIGGVADNLDPATQFSNLIVPSSTWNFTVWYRDPAGVPCGTNANFSNALTIDFLP